MMDRGAKYAYAVGRIRSLEKSLLDREKIYRMIEAKSAEEAFRVLGDSAYSKWISDSGNPYEYEKTTALLIKDTYALLKDISPEPEVLDIFMVKYDFHNAKVLLKSTYQGISSPELLLDTGTIKIGIIETAIKERDFRSVPEHLKSAIEEAMEDFNVNHDPQQIDIILDRGMFAEMFRKSESSGYDFLIGIVKLQIDLYNIKTALRIKNRENKQKLAERAFIKGGMIKAENISALIDKNEDEFMGFLKRAGYDWLATVTDEPSASGAMDGGRIRPNGSFNWIEFEKNIDNGIIDFVSKGKYVPLGMEPLVGFLFARENEAKIVRMVMAGKINGIEPEKIKERIRSLYA